MIYFDPAACGMCVYRKQIKTERWLKSLYFWGWAFHLFIYCINSEFKLCPKHATD